MSDKDTSSESSYDPGILPFSNSSNSISDSFGQQDGRFQRSVEYERMVSGGFCVEGQREENIRGEKNTQNFVNTSNPQNDFTKQCTPNTIRLDEVDGPQFSRMRTSETNISEIDNSTIARNSLSKTCLDELDGPQFSRIRVTNNDESDSRSIETYSSKTSLDKGDGPQFSRIKEPKPKKVKSLAYVSDDESDTAQFRRSGSQIFQEIRSRCSTPTFQDRKQSTSNGLRGSSGDLSKAERQRNWSGTPMTRKTSKDSVISNTFIPFSQHSRCNSRTSSQIPDFYLDETETIETGLESGGYDIEQKMLAVRRLSEIETVCENGYLSTGLEPASPNEGNHTCWNSNIRKYLTKTIPVLLGVLLFLADVGTDIQLAYRYWKEGMLFQTNLPSVLILLHLY